MAQTSEVILKCALKALTIRNQGRGLCIEVRAQFSFSLRFSARLFFFCHFRAHFFFHHCREAQTRTRNRLALISLLKVTLYISGTRLSKPVCLWQTEGGPRVAHCVARVISVLRKQLTIFYSFLV